MSPIKILVLGDTHGDSNLVGREPVRSVERALRANAASVVAVRKAQFHGATHIIQVGDFGYWPHFYDGQVFLDRLEDACAEANITFIWLDGNHENFDALEAAVKHGPKNDRDMTYIRSNVLYSPRGNGWTMAGKRFMTIGGAVSIDKGRRVPGRTWWPQESITNEQAGSIISDVESRRRAGRREVDYLFTHECSERTPWKDRLKPDFESQENREKMDAMLDSIRPTLHFHGHMHTKYDWLRPTRDYNKWIQTYGLECDGMFWNWGILDTETDKFVFCPNDVVKTR